MRSLLANITVSLLLLLPLTASSHPPAHQHQRRACGSFVAKTMRLWAYVERGRAGCPEVRRVLRAWFVDTGNTRYYGRWRCSDSSGSALAHGQIQHCTDGAHDELADYDHRLRVASARM
ncbi:MAG: hypothetical protein NVSMB51_00730 [Solirubrobacteraceae bacterium]